MPRTSDQGRCAPNCPVQKETVVARCICLYWGGSMRVWSRDADGATRDSSRPSDGGGPRGAQLISTPLPLRGRAKELLEAVLNHLVAHLAALLKAALDLLNFPLEPFNFPASIFLFELKDFIQ